MRNINGVQIDSAREDRYGVVVEARVFYDDVSAQNLADRLRKRGYRVRVQTRTVRSNNVEIYLHVVTAREKADTKKEPAI